MRASTAVVVLLATTSCGSRAREEPAPASPTIDAAVAVVPPPPPVDATPVDATPVAPGERLEIARARTRDGDYAGALDQLERWRATGAGAIKDVLDDRELAPLRTRRSFWEWADQPIALPRALARENTVTWTPRPGQPVAIPELGTFDPDQLFERAKLSSRTMRAFAAAVSDAAGRPFTDYEQVDPREPPELEEFHARGFTVLPGAMVFRLVDGPRLLAVTLDGWFEDNRANLFILALEQSPGHFAIAQLTCSRLGCNCHDSILRVSSDRRALGWFSFCGSGDPSTYERCVLHAEDDHLVTRCERNPENSEEFEGTEWRSCTAGEGDFLEDERPF